MDNIFAFAENTIGDSVHPDESSEPTSSSEEEDHESDGEDNIETDDFVPFGCAF